MTQVGKKNHSTTEIDFFFIFYFISLCRKESTSTGPTKFEVQIMAQFDNHNSQVWRVSWNITSTLLASSGDDGCVRLWKGGKAIFSP